MRRIAAVILLFVSISYLAVGQNSPAPLTNSDVIQMRKSGLGRHTIVLLIQQGPCNFDTSPKALVKLKKAGVSDDVINAMVAATLNTVVPASAQATADDFLQKALNAYGSREQLTKIHAIRWVGNMVTNAEGDTTSFEEERIQIYPDRAYLSMRSTTLPPEKLVVTPDFGYENSGRMTSALSAATAESYRQQIRFDPIYVAQHPGDYALSPQGVEKEGNADVDTLKVSSGGVEYLWKIDAETGRLLSIQYHLSSGDVIREYSDYRLVDGLYFPFKWRTTESGRTTEATISKYELNPVVDEKLFQRPGNISGTALSFKVLQSESVPFEELGGDTSVNCQISESANAAASANPLDETTFSNRTAANIRMICNPLDTTNFFPRVLNAMLVAASDGNAYIIACDKALKWSKCFPLKAGQMFDASRTQKGIEVHGFTTEGKEDDAPYLILQTKAMP
jgi:hypothetical protein